MLRNFYDAKKSINPRFTVSAFAKYLAIDVSSLNRILKGQRKITDKMFRKLGPKLDLTSNQIDDILGLTDEQSSIESYKNIKAEHFKLISEWHHFAILEMTHLKSFKEDPKWIAEQLGIKKYEAEDAMDRLFELGFLTYTDEGKLVNSEPIYNISTPGIASIHRHQMSLLTEAYSSITKVPSEKRAHSSLTVAVNKKKIDFVRERMRKFKAEIDSFLSEEGEDKDDVYHLSLAFFPAKRIS